MLNLTVSLILAYLIGSMPTSFIFAKILKDLDIRKHGSGNVGATNVFRVVGKGPAIIVLIIDILKGAFSVGYLSSVFFNTYIETGLGIEPFRILLGASAIAGHVWSVFLRFKGGKGVATAAGVSFMLAPGILLASAAVWIGIFAIFRIVSIASITAALFLPVFAIAFRQSIYLILFFVVLCTVGTYKHKENIKRLIRGQEKKLF